MMIFEIVFKTLGNTQIYHQIYVTNMPGGAMRIGGNGLVTYHLI